MTNADETMGGVCSVVAVVEESQKVVDEEPACDSEGIYEESEAGYELARITGPLEPASQLRPINADAKTGEGLPVWFSEVWEFYGKKVKFDVYARLDWISKYPDLQDILTHVDPSLVEVFPSGLECDQDGRPTVFTVNLLPGGLQLLRGQPRLVHRQMTAPDGEKIDLRTMVGRMICTASVANIADVCRCWLADMAYESSPKARRKARILLERAIGFRGEELAAHDPALKQRVMEAVTREKEKVGTERERERRDRGN